MKFLRTLILCIALTAISLRLSALPAKANALDDLEVGYWQAVGSNTIDDWDPCPAGFCFNGFANIIDSWCGGAFVSRYGTHGALWIGLCGGHGAYYGNDFYLFDIETLAWVQGNPPVDYGVSGNCDWTSSCTDPDNCKHECTCFFDRDNFPNVVGMQPTVHHTYSNIVYSPQDNLLIDMKCPSEDRAYGWDFDADDGWRSANDYQAGRDGHANTYSTYDPKRNAGISHNDNNGGGAIIRYDFDTDIGEDMGGYLAKTSRNAGAVDPTRDILVHVEFYQSEVQLGRLVLFDASDISSRTVITNVNDALHYGAPGGVMPEIHWDPVQDLFVMWPCWKDGTSASDVCTLEPPTGCTDYTTCLTGQWTWTTVAANGASPSPPKPAGANPNGAYSRFQYAPTKNVFLYINGVDEQVWAYRMSASSAAPACIDGRDNNGDGNVDLADAGCTSALDGSENECDDGIDNDGDGDTDTADVDCYSSSDPAEDPCTDGSTFCDTWCAEMGSAGVRCFGFEDQAWLTEQWGSAPKNWVKTDANCTGPNNECILITTAMGGTEGSGSSIVLESAEWDTSSSGGSSPGTLPMRFTVDGQTQFGLNSEFWVRMDHRVDQNVIDYGDQTGYKHLFIDEGDTGTWAQCVPNYSGSVCVGSGTDLEIVTQQSWGRGIFEVYHTQPGNPVRDGIGGGNKLMEYTDSTTADGNPSCTGQYRYQIQDAMCCKNVDMTGCHEWSTTEWVRYWYHITIGPDWPAQDDRIVVYKKEAADSERVKIIDSNISFAQGSTFKNRWQNCGTCTGDTAETCYKDSDCIAFGGTCENYGADHCGTGSGSGEYGKLWLDAYADRNGSAPADTVGHAYYDNITISTEDPDAPGSTGSLMIGGAISGGAVK